MQGDRERLEARVAVLEDRLAAIQAIIDEPLDERSWKGPTRKSQFARIEDLLRRVEPPAGR